MNSENGGSSKAKNKMGWLVALFVFVAVGGGAWWWNYRHETKQRQELEITEWVKQSLARKCAEDKDYSGISIKDVALIREASNKLTGYAEYSCSSETERTHLAVTLDGDSRCYQCDPPRSLIMKNSLKKMGLPTTTSASTEPSPPTQTKTTDEAEQAITPASIKVKGLYIGMDMKEAVETMKKLLAGTKWKIYEQYMLRPELRKEMSSASDEELIMAAYSEKRRVLIRITDKDTCDELYKLVIDDSAGRSRFIEEICDYNSLPAMLIGVDNKLVVIAWGPSLVNDLFCAKEMSNADFTEMFKKSYHLPSALIKLDGFMLGVQNKAVVMAQVPTAAEKSAEKEKINAERAKAFN